MSLRAHGGRRGTGLAVEPGVEPLPILVFCVEYQRMRTAGGSGERDEPHLRRLMTLAAR
jgi:hypothetical protein